jgi:hypothetical protein
LVELIRTELIVGKSLHDSQAFGIHVTENSLVELEESAIRMSRSTEHNYGVYVQDEGGLIARDSEVIAAPADSNDSMGVRLEQNATATMYRSDVTGGAAPGDDSVGIYAAGGSSLHVDGSTVIGGPSGVYSAGIHVDAIATADIIENPLIQGGGAADPNPGEAASHGVTAQSSSGAVRIADNAEIRGTPASDYEVPTYAVGIWAGRGPLEIEDNGTITGGEAREEAIGILAHNVPGEFEITRNAHISAGSARNTRGVSVGASESNTVVRIVENSIHGGHAGRPAGGYGESAGIRTLGNVESLIRWNDIDGGSVDNQGAFGSAATPENYQGPSGILPGGASAVIAQNTIRVLEPIGGSGKVFVRGVHYSDVGTEVVIKNNQILLYNVDGPIHAIETGQYSDHIVTNNTVIAQIDDVNTGDSYDQNNIGLWASHTGATIRLTNNLWYFPAPLSITVDNSGLADPEHFDNNYLLNFDDSLDDNEEGSTTWSSNQLIASSAGTGPADIWVTPDTDLADGFSGDLNLLSTAPVIDGGLMANTPELGAVGEDIRGEPRQPSSAVEDGSSDTMIDIGAYEYVAN